MSKMSVEQSAQNEEGEGPLAHALRNLDHDGSKNVSSPRVGSMSRKREPVSFKDKPGTRHEHDENYVYTISPKGVITHAHDKKLEHTFALQPLKPLTEQRSAQFSMAGLPANLRLSKRQPKNAEQDAVALESGLKGSLKDSGGSSTCAIL